MKSLTIVILLFFNIISSSQTYSWDSNGPEGGYVNCVSVSASDPNIVYVGSELGIYKSENKGESWTLTGFGDYEVISIQVSPSSKDIVIAGTFEEGLWRTTNGGDTWSENIPLSGNTINCITFDPNNHNTVYVGTGDWMREYTSEKIAVFKSTSAGLRFNTILEWESSGSPGYAQVNDLFIDPDNSDNIYIAGMTNGYSSFGALQYSTDGGSNWSNARLGSPYTQGILHVASAKGPSGNNIIYVMEGKEPIPDPVLYKTEDFGENWEEISCPYNTKYSTETFMVDPNNLNDLYIGARDMSNPLLIYNSGTEQWDHLTGSGLPSDYSTSIDISVEADPEIYFGNYFGSIYRYTSGVSSYWSQIAINATYINDIAVDPSSSELAYVCVDDEFGLFYSGNTGASWNQVADNLPVIPGVVSLSESNTSTIYAAKDYQSGSDIDIYKSTNYGIGWQKLKMAECVGTDCYTELTEILIHPDNSDNVLVSSQLVWHTPGGLHGFGGIFRKVGANAWDKLSTAPTSAMALDPNDPNILYTGKKDNGQIWKITDCWGNKSITEITPDGGIGDVTDIEVDDNSNVFVSTESGLWKYNDGSWTELSLPSSNITALTIDRQVNPEIIYAGTGEEGVYYSNNQGSSWNSHNEGLYNKAVTKLEVSGNTVWAGTEYGGVWTTDVVVGVENDIEIIPTKLALLQNYPNPFNPSTVIEYSIPAYSELAFSDQNSHKQHAESPLPRRGLRGGFMSVKLVVFDILGREVAVLVNEHQRSGSYKVNFDASGLASGIYYYQINVANYTETRKMILLR